MDFREWLLKEDPNGVALGERDYDYCDYRDADAVAFIVYRGGYIRAETHDTSSTHVRMYLSALHPDNPASDPVFVKGNPPALRELGREHDNLAGKGREALMPHMVLGRLWTAAYCWSDESEDNRGSRRRVVSFWNPLAQVINLRDEILSMIRELDIDDEYTPGEKTVPNDPREYLYEIQNNIMDYDEFMAGRKVHAPRGWDPSKLHTMEPGAAKDFVRKGLGTPAAGRQVDLPARMKSYTGD